MYFQFNPLHVPDIDTLFENIIKYAVFSPQKVWFSKLFQVLENEIFNYILTHLSLVENKML